MGNLTAVPTLRRTPKVSNSNARQSTVSSVTNGRSLPLPRHETYVVHHNLSSSLDSSLWIAIKNRRKYTPKTNRIKTTRYNIITFLPKNLFEQFHRVANVYFAILIGLNWVPIINAISRNVILFYFCRSQAVAAGDFAVDRFECLRRLLLVHGAWCFTRTSELILYTFMHNCSYVFVIFYHQLFNGFSGAVTLHSLSITGDGMGSLIAMIIERCQTSLAKRLSYTDELQATVMEVKAIGGLGTTIDVVLVNGHLRVGDTIIVAGQEGPIVTQIRGLLMPEPNRELRVRNQYQNYKTVKAARGIKIAAKDLEKSMAGLPLFVGRRDDETEYFKNEIQNILKTALSSIKLKENGVHVQASTLGSLEALLEFLKTSNIPYAGINIGPVHRKDIIRASTQLERDPQWAVILAFDVRIERDAQEHADTVGVKIFQADIIYHLFDMFIAHRERIKKENQEKYRHLAVFPCKLRVLPQYIFNSRDPIICGVLIEDGFVKLGTPICVPSKEFIELGRIVSIELNHKPLDVARKGSEVCIKIEPISGEAPKMFGRHFDENDLLMSKISRESIDIVKDHFRDDMQKSDWQLMIELKKIFNIL
ncbi:unnamed protein product [Rotaria sp. Silwood1]|nr:unnamed protein product [Rotaria sp. Silwood1]